MQAMGGLIVLFGILALGASVLLAAPATQPAGSASIYEIKACDINGRDVELSRYKGKALLIVNTASKCGNTPQYAQLEQLHEKYGGKGLAVLGFPCNQFGGQEPGSEEQIKEFCSLNYDVKFDLFSKIDVRGKGQHPLYQLLTSGEQDPKTGGAIKWNFTKFLIGRDGRIAARFEPKEKPDEKQVIEAIEKELAKGQ